MTNQLTLDDPLSSWLQKLYHQLQQAPLSTRLALCIDGVRVGSIELAIAESLVDLGVLTTHNNELNIPASQATQTLGKIALWLKERQLAGRWTGEMLPVNDSSGQTLAQVERAVVRTLGITTHAVYLIGRLKSGALWLQRRSLTKSTGAGKLDLMVGGLVSANESPEQALQREAWEEAGIHLDMNKVVEGEISYICRPIDTERGGYMVEIGRWYEITLPPSFEPKNQDGEVQEFILSTQNEIKQHMLADALTLESARILARYMGLC